MEGSERKSDRYEPLPGVAALPGWIWRRTPKPLRIALGAALLAALATAVVVGADIRDAEQEREQSEQRERQAQRERFVETLEAEQRPRFGRSNALVPASASARRRLAGRAKVMERLSALILADARRRVRRGELDGPIRRVECEPFPRTVEGVGADRDLSRRRGRFACIAITAEFGSQTTTRGVIGHQYRTLVDFETRRFAYCKVAGQAGPSREQLVTTPEACGGS
jgi:hypothetical protein